MEHNERLGLECFGKRAGQICTNGDGTRLEGPFLVLLDDHGLPEEEGLRDRLLCGTGELHGCNSFAGREVIPFIHDKPIRFTPSGFAMVLEQGREERKQGGWFYVDATYRKKFVAVGEEGVPDGWIPIEIVRYRANGLVGYLNLNSGIVTPPKFRVALSFEASPGQMGEEALVCERCHAERWNFCAPPEAHCTGEAYLIDRQGRRVLHEPGREYEEYWWCKEHPGQGRHLPSSLVFCP